MSQEHASSGNGTPVPEVVGRYAAYLRAKTNLAPQASVSHGTAELQISTGPATLVLTFGARKDAWSLRGAEVRRGEQTVTFGRGELAKAVTQLLARQAATPPRSARPPHGPRNNRPHS